MGWSLKAVAVVSVRFLKLPVRLGRILCPSMKKLGIALVLAAAFAGSYGVYLFKAPSGSLEDLDSIVNQRRRDNGVDLRQVEAHQDKIDQMAIKREAERNTTFGFAAIAALLGFTCIVCTAKAQPVSDKTSK